MGRDRPHVSLGHPQNKRTQARLPDFPPVGVGIETVVANHDLPFVGDMGGHPSDELQKKNPLGLRLGLGPDPAVDRKSCVPPRKNPIGLLPAEKLPADKKRQDLVREDFDEPLVVDMGRK